ncbi:MAG: hypothetical protein AAF975_03950, partial [Spirochaetota bacterium]
KISEEQREEIIEETREDPQTMLATMGDRIYNQGLNKGLHRGRNQANRETAKKLLRMGLTVEQVREGTGLSLAEVELLVREMRCISKGKA